MNRRGMINNITNISTRYGTNIMGMGELQQGWRRYRMSRIRKLLIVALMLSLVVAGILQYQRSQAKREAQAASLMYDKLRALMQANNESEGITQAHTLMVDYEKTIYAPLAAFMAAKWAVSHAQWDKALEHLQFVVSHAPKGSFTDIARLRMTPIFIEQKNYTEALALLDQVQSIPYVPLVEEFKGDIYVLTQERDKAREAYAKAMQALPMGGPLVGRLQLKQIEVGFKDVPEVPQ